MAPSAQSLSPWMESRAPGALLPFGRRVVLVGLALASASTLGLAAHYLALPAVNVTGRLKAR